VTKRVLHFGGRGCYRTLCCLGFGGLLGNRVGILSVFVITISL